MLMLLFDSFLRYISGFLMLALFIFCYPFLIDDSEVKSIPSPLRTVLYLCHPSVLSDLPVMCSRLLRTSPVSIVDGQIHGRQNLRVIDRGGGYLLVVVRRSVFTT